METILALLFIAVGLWTAISPKGSFQFKSKMAKSIGITMTASSKSYSAMRYLGIGIAIIGFLLYFR